MDAREKRAARGERHDVFWEQQFFENVMAFAFRMRYDIKTGVRLGITAAWNVLITPFVK